MSDLCSVCHLKQFKYKCPACGTRSCSLVCVKKHKLEQNCSGEIDPTNYIKREGISATEVNRDYNFLLNVNRKIEIGKGDAASMKPLAANVLKRALHNNNNNHRQNKRIYTNSFEDTNVSVKRGVNVKYVPKGMSRSNVNKTGFDKKKNIFNWTIEWLLIDSDINRVKHRFTSYKCNEASRLIDCFPSKNFTKFIVSQNAAQESVMVPPVDQKNEDPTESNDVAEIEPQFHFFIKNYAAKIERKLYSLDPNEVIATLLKGKTVLEFPTIYVSLENQVKKMKVIKVGDDASSGESSGTESDTSSESDSGADSDSSDSSDEEESNTKDNDDDEEVREDGEEAPEESSAKNDK